MAITYPINDDNVLEVSFDTGTTWMPVAEGWTERTPAMNEESEDYYFFGKRGGKSSLKTGMQRTFNVTGIRAVGDPFQDKVFAFDFLFGENRGIMYRMYDRTSNKGEQGSATILINSDGSGAANARQSVDIDIKSDGKPTAFTKA